MEVKIRIAKKDDAEYLLEIYSYYVANTAVSFEYEVPSVQEFERRICTTLENYPYLVAEVDGKIAGTAGVESVGEKYKVKHRAEFGIGILKEYWGLGLGKALTKACIQCAKAAGYDQLELNVVAENERALSLYRSLGFIEYGRNPRGFNSKKTGYQELVYMLLKL